MNTITKQDGTPIYFKDWGTGKPVEFSDGWPLFVDGSEAVFEQRMRRSHAQRADHDK